MKKNRQLLKKRRFLKLFFIILLFIILVITLLVVATPYPAALLVRKMFEIPPQTPPAGYVLIEQEVMVNHDISYESKERDGFFDLYRPTNTTKALPIILWVHGGAYVGGDKSDISIYSTMLAHEGYAVVTMNYARAPEKQYPSPIYQMDELYDFLQAHKEEYRLDLSRIVLAGDSAGAQIAAQYGVIQANPEYRSLTGFTQKIEPSTIKGMLLYCGPYDIGKLTDTSSTSLNLMLSRVGWAYIGKRDWKTNELTKQASIVDFISADFPPAFVTDGNTGSFEKHGLALLDQLAIHNVPHESLFFSLAETKTNHEYQFLLDTPEGEKALAETIAFLEEYLPTK